MNLSELRQRLETRFHPGHAVWALVDAEDFAGVADAIKAKYTYEHPLEAIVRGMTAAPPEPEPDPEPEPEPEPVQEEPEPAAAPRRGRKDK